jgi:DNA-binding transcriptional LysR family regulator
MKNNFSVSDAKFICAAKEVREPKKMANILDMSQASINVCVQRIEKKLGKKIFFRKQNPSTFDLTEDGLELYPYCKRMVESSDALQESLETQDSHLQGEVKITATQPLLEYFYVPYLVEFIKKHPGIDVSIKQLDDTFCIEQSVNEFYFTSEVKDDTDTYAYFPYHCFVQKLWASKSYLENFGKIETIDDLYRHNLLFQRGSLHNDKIFGSARVKAALSYNFNRIRTLNITGSRVIDRLCEEGLGITSGSVETKTLAKLDVEQVLPDFTGDSANIHIKINKRMLTKKVGRFFLDWLFECRDKSLKKINITATYEYKNLFK